MYKENGGSRGGSTYNRGGNRNNSDRYGAKPAYNRDGAKPAYNRDRSYRNDRRRDESEAPTGFRNGEAVLREDSNARQGSRKTYNKPSYDRERKYASRDAYGENRGRKPYGRDDKPYNRDNKPYNRDNKPYNRDNKPYNRSDKPGERIDETKPAKPQVNEVNTANAQEDELPYLVMGRNAVREAIKSGRSIDRILVSRDPDGSLREIMSAARDRNLRIDEVDKSRLDELCLPFGHGGKTGNHQGIVAQVPGVEYSELSDMLNDAKAAGEKPFIILLDGIEDPHNLGSIIRSAVCAGAHGVVIPKRRAVSVTAAACKASAGAVEYCRVARVANLSGAIDRLKDDGLWIAGADMQGMAMGRARMEGALALVIGSEGEGLSRLVKEKCDFLVSIPMTGKIDSLNAAVAAAVLMFEKRRQDSPVK